MQKLAEICIKRPVFASMIILSLVVVGGASYFRLGVDRFPKVDLPTVSVRTDLPGASTEDVETQVSQRIEEAVNTIEGITELRSISGAGKSVIIVTFALNRNIDVATQDVRDRVASLLPSLPRDMKAPVISKNDNDASPVMSIAISGNRSLRELTELADKVILAKVERSPGVGDAWIVGGLPRAIKLWIDADRLAAYQIPIAAVRDAIARQNSELPGGNVTRGGREESLRTLGRMPDARAFEDLVVATVNGAPIRVRDLGRAEDGFKEQRSLARLDGVPTVIIEVRRQSGENTVAVIDGVKGALARLAPQLPPDVRVQIIRDQSRYIHAALHEINVHLVLGSVLACLVVLAFMRSWRSTIIAGIAIPTSVIAAFGAMWALGFTLNSVTMLALVLMVGIVIDDAIVVLENIFRYVEEKKVTPFEAARLATADIGLAVMATTFSLVVIFVPVAFMSSVSGRFLYQFGFTAAVAVLVSLLVSFTLTPMMSARLLRAEDAGHDAGAEVARSRRGFYAAIDRAYLWSLGAAMRHRWVIVALSAVVIAASVPLYGLVKQEYIPSDVDEAEFDVIVAGPDGLSMSGMSEAMEAVEKEIRGIPAVRIVLATTGGDFLGRVNTGNIYVRIAPHTERTVTMTRLWEGIVRGRPLAAFQGNQSQRDVMQEVRRRLRTFRDFRFTVRNAPSFNIGGGSFEIDFVLRGPDLEALAEYGERLRRKSEELGGILDADITLKLEKPELLVQIDRERAADLGVDASQVATTLRVGVGGEEEVSRFRDPTVGEDYHVDIRLAEVDRDRASTIARLYVPRQGGGLVRLDNLVKIESGITAARIDRSDRQREVRLRASVAPGYGQADRIEALRGAVREMNLPPAYSTAVSGRARELERTFTEFLWVFLLSVVFMYMILASQFESLLHPLTILLSLPLSVPFALFSLWWTGNTLNLYSALGILVLFGVVKKNAILQIDHTNNLRAAGVERQAAIMQANRDRLRPILMTTLALVAGMLPLWVGSGPGAEERRAIAVVVIGGQTLCLLLTLLVTPVAYSLFEDFARVLGWRPAFRRRRRAWGSRLPAPGRWRADEKAGRRTPVERGPDPDVSRP
jgi:hydrophobe/amphiphile efflux-1 (HAE1) family protein